MAKNEGREDIWEYNERMSWTKSSTDEKAVNVTGMFNWFGELNTRFFVPIRTADT